LKSEGVFAFLFSGKGAWFPWEDPGISHNVENLHVLQAINTGLSVSLVKSEGVQSKHSRSDNRIVMEQLSLPLKRGRDHHYAMETANEEYSTKEPPGKDAPER